MNRREEKQQQNKVSKYKIVFLGDQSVGKTAVLQRIIEDNFNEHSQPTIGIDFISKTVHTEKHIVKLQLWDTAGQEKFRSLIPSYVRDCKAVICVFDLTKSESLENLEKWISFVKEQRGNDLMIIILGNKADLEQEINFSEERLIQLKKQFDIEYHYLVSAKSGKNVNKSFSEITSLLIEKEEQEQAILQQSGFPPINYINNTVINNDNRVRLGANGSGYNGMGSKQCQC